LTLRGLKRIAPVVTILPLFVIFLPGHHVVAQAGCDKKQGANPFARLLCGLC
jgi:hypothetical protein